VQELWVQQRVRNRDFDLFKIKGEENPGDLFTKAGLAESRITELLRLLNCEYRDGRAAAAPALRQEGGTKCFALNRARRSGGRRSGKEKEEKGNKGTTPQRPRSVPQQRSTTTADWPASVVHRRSPASWGWRRSCQESGTGCQPTLARASPTWPAPALALQPKRWADEPEEEGEYSEEQVQDLLRSVLGLPHLVLDGREKEQPPPAHAEAEEPVDAMTSEGLAIGRAHAGRRGLPGRLRMPRGMLAAEGH